MYQTAQHPPVLTGEYAVSLQCPGVQNLHYPTPQHHNISVQYLGAQNPHYQIPQVQTTQYPPHWPSQNQLAPCIPQDQNAYQPPYHNPEKYRSPQSQNYSGQGNSGVPHVHTAGTSFPKESKMDRFGHYAADIGKGAFRILVEEAAKVIGPEVGKGVVEHSRGFFRSGWEGFRHPERAGGSNQEQQ